MERTERLLFRVYSELFLLFLFKLQRSLSEKDAGGPPEVEKDNEWERERKERERITQDSLTKLNIVVAHRFYARNAHMTTGCLGNTNSE